MTVPAVWDFAVIGFDHMHAGDFIRKIQAHPRAQVCGVWDSQPDRLASVCDELEVPTSVRFDTVEELLSEAEPRVAAVCSTTRDHGRWVTQLAAAGVDIILEKPFATSLEEADAMIRTAEEAGVRLTVNWPLGWYPPHRTTERLIREGTIGRVRETHYYDGNRGPLRHLHDKKELTGGLDQETKRQSWWYQAVNGGGSLLDYLGYGATLSTWFRGGEVPADVSARVHIEPGDEVDEQSVVVAGFHSGLSTFQTRWGTFTDPWAHQPQPRCGFVVVGSAGTISSYDYADHVTVQTADRPNGFQVPVDELPPHLRNGVAHMVWALEESVEIGGPMSVATSRAGQQIVDAARASVAQGTSVRLDPAPTSLDRTAVGENR